MSAAPVENQYIVNIANVYGPILIGTQVSSALWGVSCMQGFLYFFNYPDDRLFLKALVTFVWLLGTASQIMILISPWDTLILRWGSLIQLNTPSKYLVNHVPVAGVVVLTVQIFYLHRIFLLGGKKWRFVVYFLGIISVFSFVTTIPLAIWDNQAAGLVSLHDKRVLALEAACRACPAAVDIIISFSMVYLLSRGQRASFRRTNGMIFRLILITINCGVWTGIIALIDFILAASIPSSFAYVAFELCVTALYVNSLLANLNSREYARGSEFQFNSFHVSGAGIALRNIYPVPRGPAQTVDTKDTGVTIRVDTDTAVRADSFKGDPSKTVLRLSGEDKSESNVE